ncbi:putative flavin dependent monooxygenase [Microthyrium microscopicum]|uniref:Putative flavin dependent monooxygenase n=1 Tax=Microthyrium microscopicum TaxID=703497 RepID=A0A6A6UI97_9PEZI|nr:putative flavin dependent monooxygenase [Microthyrium microscopicum]
MTAPHAQRIAVIGAGAGGLTAAKYLRAEKCFSVIDIYEQRSATGGLWIHSPQISGDGIFSVPQTDPSPGPEIPVESGSSKDKVFISPVYDLLETNIPKDMMKFSDLDFPEHLPLFPKHEDVKIYLQQYGKEVEDLISFDTQVTNIRVGSRPNTTWTLDSLHLPTGKRYIKEYDAIVVANGHYFVPCIPSIDGLREWSQKHPGSITHSKYYRSPAQFAGKKVVVVGSHASGLDISQQLTSACQQPVYLSQKSVSEMAAGFKANAGIQSIGQIDRVDPGTRQVTLKDGTILDAVDAIIFCTGYFYSFDFLKSISPPLITHGNMVHGTYEHLFSVTHPSLSILGLPQKVIPFPITEMQAAVVARVNSGRLFLPSPDILKKWEGARLAKTGSEDQFHTFGYPEDAGYMDMLVDWAAQAEHRPGLENDGKGKVAPKWSNRMRWMRDNIPKLRKAFSGLGEARIDVRTVEELGMNFDEEIAWKYKDIANL